MTPRSLLIVRLSALGDVIHVLPALAALRAAFPQAKLGWAVEDRAASLLRGHPQLDRLHVIPRQDWTGRLKRGAPGVLTDVRRAARALRAERYEVTLDFQSNFRSSLLARISGAPMRIGQPRPFAKEGSALLGTHRPPAISREAHKIERNLELLRPLGVRPETAPRPLIPAPDPADTATLPAADGRPWVVLHAGVSAFGALKAWREERFVGLGTRLAADGARVLFAWGGAGERAQAEALATRAPGTEVAPPTANLLVFVELLRRAALVVCVDSGPLHLAAAVGTPVLGLYGPKHTGTYGPYWPGTAVVTGAEPCSPCRHRRCPREDAQVVPLVAGGELKISPCMDGISVEAALEVARRQLAARQSSGG